MNEHVAMVSFENLGKIDSILNQVYSTVVKQNYYYLLKNTIDIILICLIFTKFHWFSPSIVGKQKLQMIRYNTKSRAQLHYVFIFIC